MIIITNEVTDSNTCWSN